MNRISSIFVSGDIPPDAGNAIACGVLCLAALRT